MTKAASPRRTLRARAWPTGRRASRCEAQEVLLIARGGAADGTQRAAAAVVGCAAAVHGGHRAATDGSGRVHRAPLHAARRPRAAGARRPAAARLFAPETAAPAVDVAPAVQRAA